jgi:hypothetical protein
VKWQSHQVKFPWSLLFDSGSGRIIYIIWIRPHVRKQWSGPVGEVVITPSNDFVGVSCSNQEQVVLFFLFLRTAERPDGEVAIIPTCISIGVSCSNQDRVVFYLFGFYRPM